MSELGIAVERLSSVLGEKPLTSTIAELEYALDGKGGSAVASAVEHAGVDLGLLLAAVRVRRDLGRVSDLIHAAAIALALPTLLEDEEVLATRPSLAAGNDPTRPFDLETNLRVAEFKLSYWKGADAIRKRQAFKDLVHLAAEASDRRKEFFVVGREPAHFLRTSRSSAAWALDRSPSTRDLFQARFGPLDISIRDFTAGPGAKVTIIEIDQIMPELSAAAAALSN